MKILASNLESWNFTGRQWVSRKPPQEAFKNELPRRRGAQRKRNFRRKRREAALVQRSSIPSARKMF